MRVLITISILFGLASSQAGCTAMLIGGDVTPGKSSGELEDDEKRHKKQ